MSSSAYFAEIRPDSLLRGVVLASGAGLALSGVFLILLLPVHAGWQALLCLGWAWRCLTYGTLVRLMRVKPRAALDARVPQR